MKKKILICTLCLTTIFSSINIKKSYANPVVGKAVEVSIAYAIGRIAFDVLGFLGDVGDIIDMGTNVYNKMSDKEKNDIKNQVEFTKEGFSYDETVKETINTYIPSKGHHYMTNYVRPLSSPNIYESSSSMANYSASDKEKYFNQYKKSRDYQGITVDYMMNIYPGSSGKYNYILFYRFPNFPGYTSISYAIMSSNTLDAINSFTYSIDVPSISNGSARLSIVINGIYYKLANLGSTCPNCPHDYFKPNTVKSYPSSSELDYIDKNYPDLENDIYDKINGNLGGGNDDNNNSDNDNNSNGGGSNGGGSNGGTTNSTIITSPPSFPNLEEFNFNGLELEPLTDLFSNFKTKFPFSLPFDLANLIGGLSQDPIPPRFETEIFDYNFVIDFTEFEVLAQIVRAFTLLSYVVALIFITKSFGG